MLTRGLLRGVAGYDLPLIQPSGGDAAETTAFLARTSGLDATHINAYKALINGLVADGVWALLDCLYIFATQDSITACLNLISASFPITVNGSPVFTADSGYKDSGGSTDYLGTAFNPTTASSPKFVQNSAHMSLWSIDDGAVASPAIGNGGSGAAGESNMFLKYIDGNFYSRINDNSSGGTANANTQGHFIGNRSTSNDIQHYKNGSSFGTISQASAATINADFLILRAPGISSDAVHRIAAASIGGSLDATKASAFYTRKRTFMTAVGVP